MGHATEAKNPSSFRVSRRIRVREMRDYSTFDGEEGPLDSNSRQTLGVLGNVIARGTSSSGISSGASQAYALKFVHVVAFTNPIACKSVAGPDMLRTTVLAMNG